MVVSGELLDGFFMEVIPLGGLEKWLIGGPLGQACVAQPHALRPSQRLLDA